MKDSEMQELREEVQKIYQMHLKSLLFMVEMQATTLTILDSLFRVRQSQGGDPEILRKEFEAAFADHRKSLGSALGNACADAGIVQPPPDSPWWDRLSPV